MCVEHWRGCTRGIGRNFKRELLQKLGGQDRLTEVGHGADSGVFKVLHRFVLSMCCARTLTENVGGGGGLYTKEGIYAGHHGNLNFPPKPQKGSLTMYSMLSS